MHFNAPSFKGPRGRSFLLLLFCILQPVNALTYISQAIPQVTIANGVAISTGNTVYNLQVSCRADETDLLDGTSTDNTLRNVFVNCSSPSRTITTVVDRFVTAQTSVMKVVSSDRISVAESKNTTAILDQLVNYLINRNKGIDSVLHRRRRDGQHISSTSLTGALAGIVSGAVIAGTFAPGIGIGIAGGGIAGVFANAVTDTNSLTQSHIAATLGGTSTAQYQACQYVLAGGVGIDGLGNCLDAEFNIANGLQGEINALFKGLVATNNRITSLTSIVFNVQSQLQATILTVNQLSQTVQSVLKTQQEQSYIDQTTASVSASNANAVAEASASTNINNANIATVIQQTQASTQLAIQTLQNSITTLARQEQSELTVTARRILQQVAVQMAAQSQQLQNLMDNDILQLNSLASQTQGSVNTVINAVNTIIANIQVIHSDFSDLYTTVANIVTTLTTAQALTQYFYNAAQAIIETANLLPLIGEGWAPPPNLQVPTKWMGREVTVTLPRIYNTQTQTTRSCSTPFSSSVNWKSDVNTAMDQNVVMKMNIPNILDINYPQFGDVVFVQALVAGNWVNLTTVGCDSSCTVSLPPGNVAPVGICPSTHSSYPALVLTLQSFALYQQSHPQHCTTVISPFVITSCNATTIPNGLIESCKGVVNGTNFPITVNATFSGNGCSSGFARQIISSSTNCTNANQVQNGQCSYSSFTGINCTVASVSLSTPLTSQVCTTSILPINQGPTNVLHGDYIYFDGSQTYNNFEIVNNFITPQVSSTLQLQVPSDVRYITNSSVLQISRVNTSIALLNASPIDNATPIYLSTLSSQAPLILNSFQCLTSSSLSTYNGTKFRVVPFNPTGPITVDTGIPQVVAKRSAKSTSVERHGRSLSSVYLSEQAACSAADVFRLVVDSSERYEVDIASCTSVPNCVLVRSPRVFGAQFSLYSGGPNLGDARTFEGTKTLPFGTTYATYTGFSWTLDGLQWLANGAGLYFFMEISIPAGLKLIVTVMDTTTGNFGQNIYTSTAFQPATLFEIPFKVPTIDGMLYPDPYTTGGNNYNNPDGFQIMFDIDFEENYDTYNYIDMCAPNTAPNGVVLTSTACSFLSTAPVNLLLPTTDNIKIVVPPVKINGGKVATFYYQPPGAPAPFLIVENTCGPTPGPSQSPNQACGGYYKSSGSTAGGVSGSSQTALSVVLNATVTPSECFAPCNLVDTDRATCLEVDFTDCVWAKLPNQGQNVCTKIASTTANFNLNSAGTASVGTSTANFPGSGCASPTPGSSPWTFTTSYQLCGNGNIASAQITGITSLPVYSSYLTPSNFDTYTLGNIFPIQWISNPNCTAIYSSIPPTTFTYATFTQETFSSYSSGSIPCPGYIHVTTPTYTSSVVTPPTLYSCRVSDIAAYFANAYPTATVNWNSYPPAALCLSTTQLAYNQSTFSYQNLNSNNNVVQGGVNFTYSNNGFLSPFLPVPYLSTPPTCTWDTTAQTCSQYDQLYSNDVQQFLLCSERLLQTDEVGACTNSPAGNIMYNGQSYSPRCVYIKPQNSASGTCATFYADNVFNGPAIGPYNMPVSLSNPQTIVSACLTPGTQCYFEAYGGVGASSSTQNWYNLLPESFKLGYTCSSYNNDQLGCVPKTQNGTATTCRFEPAGLCLPLCNTSNNNPIGCSNIQPYDACYYSKSTGLCQDNNVNYLSLPSCSGYQCFSASTICYAWSKDIVDCEANSNCQWMNVENSDGTTNNNASYCELLSNQQDPECYDSNNNPLSFCNVTSDMGISTLLSTVFDECNINTTMSNDAFIATCVTQLDHNGQHCFFAAFGTTYQRCFSSGDTVFNTFQSTYGSQLTVSTITWPQYEASLLPAYRTYTTTIAGAPFRTSAGITISNFRTAGILLSPDSPQTIYACESNYTAVADYCCLTSQIDSTSGQCGSIFYHNPNHPTTFFQNQYIEYCEAELGPNEEVIMQDLSYITNYMGQVEPDSTSPNFIVNSLHCPTYANTSDIIYQKNNYTLYPFVLGDVAVDLQWPLLSGTFTCTIPLSINQQDVMMSRIGVLAWHQMSNYLQVQLYNGTAVNVTYWQNISAIVENAEVTDVTWRNVTQDVLTTLFSVMYNDVQYVQVDYQARYGLSPVMWGSRVPPGVFVEKTLVTLNSNVYSMLATIGWFGSISSKFFKVYRVLSYIDTVEATVTVYDPSGNTPNVTYSPINSVVVYDNLNLLPQIRDAFVFENYNGQVISPPFSRCTPCSDVDWCFASTRGPLETSFNYTDLSGRCPLYHPKMLYWSLTQYACIMDPNTPPGQLDYRGIIAGTSYQLESDFKQATGWNLLYASAFVDNTGTPLWQFYNNTANTHGTEFVLNVTQTIQQTAQRLGCPNVLNNFIPANETMPYQGSNTTYQSMDFYRPIFLLFESLIPSAGNYSALQTAVNTYVAPLVASKTSAACGNCGLEYGTICDYLTAPLVMEAPLSCQNGLVETATKFKINKVSDTVTVFTALPGTANMILNFNINNVGALTNVLDITSCPVVPSSQSSFVDCNSATGAVICTFNVRNPSNSANMEIVFGTNSSSTSSQCTQSSTIFIAPLNGGGGQVELCPGTTNQLFVKRNDGFTCFTYTYIAANTTVLTNTLNNSTVIIELQNTTDVLTAGLIQVGQDVQANSVALTNVAQTISLLSLNISNTQSIASNNAAQVIKLQSDVTSGFANFTVSLTQLVSSANFTFNYLQQLNTNTTQAAQQAAAASAAAQALHDNVIILKDQLDNSTAALQDTLKTLKAREAQDIANLANETLTTNTILGNIANLLHSATGLNGNSAFIIGMSIAIALVGIATIYAVSVVSYLLYKDVQRTKAINANRAARGIKTDKKDKSGRTLNRQRSNSATNLIPQPTELTSAYPPHLRSSDEYE